MNSIGCPLSSCDKGAFARAEKASFPSPVQVTPGSGSVILTECHLPRSGNGALARAERVRSPPISTKTSPVVPVWKSTLRPFVETASMRNYDVFGSVGSIIRGASV